MTTPKHVTPKQAITWFLLFLIFISACKAVTGQALRPAAPTQPAVQVVPNTATALPRSPVPPASNGGVAPTFTANAPVPATDTGVPGITSTTPAEETPAATAAAGQGTVDGVRACAFIPGVSKAAVMPPEVMVAGTPTPFPTPTLPASSAVDDATKEKQLQVFQQIWDTVNKDYVYRDFNGRDWKAIGEKYKQLINQGLSQDNFYAAMYSMIAELGDEHSSFLSPKDVANEKKAMQGQTDFVGIGGYTDVTIPGRLVITAVMPNSPAEEAGLKPHDIILAVDGGPVLNSERLPRTLGEEGTTVTLTVETPGQPKRDLQLVRRHITSQPRVDYCLMPGTRIGYISWATYEDATVPDQTIAALKKMTAGQKLDGLILDNRYNNGGLITVLQSLLELFTQGKQGDFINAKDAQPFVITPKDINGTQTVPLVVLTGPRTYSAAEMAAGMLQVTRHARVVGLPTGGLVEELLVYSLDDGSQLNLATRTFRPVGMPNNVWENKGVTPDVLVPMRWDLFTEANDPAIARAVDLLMQK